MAFVAYLDLFAALVSLSAAQVLHGVLDYCEGSGKVDYKAMTHSGYALNAPQLSLGLAAAASLLSCVQRCRGNLKCKAIAYKRDNCELFSIIHIASYLVADSASTVVQLIKVPCEYHKRVHGAWTSWTTTLCTKTCGGGSYTKTRTCTNPAPAYTGSPCPGLGYQSFTCNTWTCAIPGGWTAWEGWKTCETWGACPMMPCQERDHHCTNPPPQFGGRCEGGQWGHRACQ